MVQVIFKEYIIQMVYNSHMKIRVKKIIMGALLDDSDVSVFTDFSASAS